MTRINGNAVVETNKLGSNVQIDEFAIVRNGAQIGDNVHIYPYAFVSEGAVIGDGTRIYHGTLIGKIPDGAGNLSRTVKFKPEVKIGKNCALGPYSVIYCDVNIGNDTLIGDHASIRENSIIGNSCIIGRSSMILYKVKIGDKTKIMDLVHVTGNTVIGSNVFIAMSVSMANDNKFDKREYVEELDLGPTIEDNASIGVGAILLPGVRIGNGALVAAGSVVTKDVLSRTKVIGVPAKEVRSVQ